MLSQHSALPRVMPMEAPHLPGELPDRRLDFVIYDLGRHGWGSQKIYNNISALIPGATSAAFPAMLMHSLHFYRRGWPL